MFRKIIKGLKDVWCGTLEFDTEPKKDSFNPVTSGGVYDAINGAEGAKEIVYFDVDPSDPPSGIYEAIGEALSNNKEPVIKNDGTVYFYSSTSTDKYIFVGGYDTDVVNYTTVTVSDDDSVVKETVDTIEGMVFPLYYHSNDGGFTVADKTGHALTKTEIADAYRAGQIFMFSSYPASNTQAHWGYCCDINIESDNTGYAEFLILDAFGGYVYSWEKYRINLSSGTEFVTLWGPNTSYSTGYSGYYADGATTVSVSGSQDFSATQKAQGRSNIGAASASDVTALQSQVSSLSDVSAYSVKGEATVAQLNAGPSGIQAGWAYQLTDSGTLTDGSLAVVAGDTVAWDGTKWFPLVKSDYYATKTYAQNVAASIAPPFDPTRDSEHAYPAGYSVTYTDGKVYTFKVDHYGAWVAADVYQDGEILGSVNASKKIISSMHEDINERGNFVVTSDSFVKLFDGYVSSSTGIVHSSNTDAYQLKYKLFANDSFVKVARSVESAINANVLFIVDDIAKVSVDADVSKYIVDKGTTYPFEETFFVPAGSYFVWGWQSGSASGTTISSTDAVKLKTLVNNLTEEVAQIEQDISYYESVENIAINTLILSSAYVNASGQVKSWSNTNYNIFAYQAQTEEYVKIKRTESVYANNDVICKCATISGIAIGNYIDGEVLCTGSDYPFETIVHLNAGEYIVRSGTGAGNSIFTKLEKKHVKDKLFPLEGLKVDFEGDSIMAAHAAGGGWPSLIELNEKVVATNNGSSGSKIAGILTRIKSRTPSNYDMIVVQGGFNDGATPLGTFDRDDYRDEGTGDYDQTTFYGAMEILCRYCLTNFSKALFIVGYNWGNDTWNTTLANACVAVCEKWGMPYVDLRSKAGFNLHVLSLREKYGVYIGDVAAYDTTAGYSLDEQTKYDGRVYKANQNIPSPAGAFDASKWTYIGMEYDQCHCNEDGYKKSVGAIVEMMKSI